MQMKILPINVINYRNIQPQQPQKSIIKLNALNHDIISFAGSRQKTSKAEDFLKEFEQCYPDMDLNEAAFELTSKEENKLGQGAKKVVYSIDGIDDFVIARLLKPDNNFGDEFIECENPYPKYNFSLPVLRNSNFMIMEKVNGQSYGMYDWRTKYVGYIQTGKAIPSQDAKSFLDKLSELEKFPLNSFVDFASQVKYLSDHGIKIDFFNPNNIMIDFANKKIQYFDFFEDPSKFLFLKPDINCTQDIICVLCDALLHDECMKALDEKDKIKLSEVTKSIIQKCKMAGKIVGLSDAKTITERTYSFVQNSLMKKGLGDKKYMQCYKKFESRYFDSL